ncbi:MAG: TIGR00153 family protein [Gammaproteobacteria bacterium]|nr:TIGR00153 family protein [Gammaproteobacteria bacterium]
MASQSGILAMFARSPIKPLEQHMNKALTCAQLLLPFIKAVTQADWTEAKAIQQQISQAEQEADSMKQDFRLHLPKNLFLPVARHDLLELLEQQDTIANVSRDIAGIMLGRRMSIPNEISMAFSQHIERSVDAATQATKAINELEELQESGFRGREVDLVATMIQKLNAIEKETDVIQIKLREQLFHLEKTLAPIDVMFLYKVIEQVGFLADTAQRVGSRLRMLTAN